ncbi:hypothetical protein L208DRAFT_1369906, partial [Tricholoma matsutake]
LRSSKIFTKATVPLNDVVNAWVTVIRPVKLGDYGVYSPRLHQGLHIAHVIALYSKTGGKQGKHESISDLSNISAVSNIAVQIFEYTHAHQFCSIPQRQFSEQSNLLC